MISSIPFSFFKLILIKRFLVILAAVSLFSACEKKEVIEEVCKTCTQVNEVYTNDQYDEYLSNEREYGEFCGEQLAQLDNGETRTSTATSGDNVTRTETTYVCK